MKVGETDEGIKQQQSVKFMEDMMRKIKAKGRMDANNSWWVSEMLAVDCKKAWLHQEWEGSQAALWKKTQKK